MTYRTEFPTFELGSGVAIPEDWHDLSWHNDACPKWSTPKGLCVWIDYENDEDREADSDCRFIVCDEENLDIALLESNDWSDVLRCVAAHATMTFDQFIETGRDVTDLGEALQEETLEGIPGRVYAGNLYVEQRETEWYTIIDRSEYVDELEVLLEPLYQWALNNGFFDPPSTNWSNEIDKIGCDICQYVPKQYRGLFRPLDQGGDEWWHWKSTSAVGRDVRVLLESTDRVIGLLRDVSEQRRYAVWKAVARQALVYAFS